ncbi:Resolvase, N terminal domain [seawater metagenome]|uniref:Resolvase, N terminal domain n=1 Tax=seawater metagenome TaxID=1561972 RepID=A0A5E8CKF9_9ZZZZ
MKNYLYCRVSSEKQADFKNGHTSLEVQQNALYKYCEENDIDVEHCYYDIYSARDMSKLYYLNHLISICKKDDKILFYDVTRFSRNTQQALNILEKLAEKGISVFSVNDVCGYSSISQKNMFRVLLSKAENESDLLSSRIKASVNFRRSRGDYIGNPGYGFKCVKNSKGIRKKKTNKEELAVIHLIKKMFNDNYSFKEISFKLNEMKIKKRNRSWSPLMIKHILKKYKATKIGMKDLLKSLNSIPKNTYSAMDIDEVVIDDETTNKKKKKYNLRK